MIHHAISPQAIQVLTTKNIPEDRTGTAPFNRGPVSGLGDRLAVFQPVLIEMFRKIVFGFFNNLLALGFSHFSFLDDFQPTLTIYLGFVQRLWHRVLSIR